ncbi:MAG: DsbE family thiol:disulfide interchange protein [Rhodospirillales bacterium]|nr:DsbE family thiol:disulfide interchange protein [Rhodospirillales bacterium]
MERVGILRRPLLLMPLGAAVVGGIGFVELLMRAEEGRYNPHTVPNLMVGHAVPPFSVGAAPPGTGFSTADLQHLAKPVLVNFFASWCVPCHAEAPLLMQLKAEGVPIWGIDYADTEPALGRFLAADGNPFARLGGDPKGEAAIAWGISGVPESFLIDRSGIIRWHLGDPLSPAIVSAQLIPLVRKYG